MDLITTATLERHKENLVKIGVMLLICFFSIGFGLIYPALALAFFVIIYFYNETDKELIAERKAVLIVAQKSKKVK